jgi:hypothetical protein
MSKQEKIPAPSLALRLSSLAGAALAAAVLLGSQLALSLGYQQEGQALLAQQRAAAGAVAFAPPSLAADADAPLAQAPSAAQPAL